MDHDLIIIGGGAGGLGALRAALWSKADVLMINDGPPGGDCTFTGCVPSKTMLSAARNGASFGEAMTRVRATIERIAATESAEVLMEHGASFIKDRARLVTHDTVAVGERRITAPRIIVATGGRPSIPPIPGLATTPHHTNETIFSLVHRPRRLGVIGGGTIGCEMAEAFAMLGSEVVLVEGAERLLPQEEAEASAIVEASLAARGVTVITGTGIESVGRSSVGVELRLAGRTVEVDEVLLAAGRTPNTEGLGLDELGASFDADGHVETDDRLRTAIPGVYAVGDVTGKLPFTHAADEMGRIAAGNALKKGYRGRYRTHHTPWVTFTSPEVARVGVTEAEASARGGRICELPMSEMDRAVTDGREDGFIKLITGPKRVTRHLAGGKVIGATIVAERAGEMIHELRLRCAPEHSPVALPRPSTPIPPGPTGCRRPQGNSSVRWRDEHGGRRVREVLRLAGLAVTLLAAVVWALLAARTPTTTYHVVPLIVASAWPAIDGSVGAGLTQRRSVNAAHGGVVVGPATAIILGVEGDKDGPTHWEHRELWPYSSNTLRSPQSVHSPGSSTQCGRLARRPRSSEPAEHPAPWPPQGAVWSGWSDRSTVQACLTCSSRSAVT